MRAKQSSRSAWKLTLGKTKIIEAQSDFLDETTETLWRWRYLSMKVAFNGLEQRARTNMQCLSEGYPAGIWDRARASFGTKQASREGSLPRKPTRASSRYTIESPELRAGRLDQIVRQRLPPKERAEALAPIQAALRSYLVPSFSTTSSTCWLIELQLTPPHSAAGDRK